MSALWRLTDAQPDATVVTGLAKFGAADQRLRLLIHHLIADGDALGDAAGTTFDETTTDIGGLNGDLTERLYFAEDIRQVTESIRRGFGDRLGI